MAYYLPHEPGAAATLLRPSFKLIKFFSPDYLLKSEVIV